MEFLDISLLGVAIDMLSKSNKNLSRGISGSLDLWMPHSRRKEKESPTCKPKDQR